MVVLRLTVRKVPPPSPPPPPSLSPPSPGGEPIRKQMYLPGECARSAQLVDGFQVNCTAAAAGACWWSSCAASPQFDQGAGRAYISVKDTNTGSISTLLFLVLLTSLSLSLSLLLFTSLSLFSPLDSSHSKYPPLTLSYSSSCLLS